MKISFNIAENQFHKSFLGCVYHLKITDIPIFINIKEFFYDDKILLGQTSFYSKHIYTLVN